MTAGFQNEPSFNLFIPSYVQATESFVLRLPETYGRVLLTLQPFTAGDKVKYRLEPKAHIDKGKEKQKDTGYFWANVNVSAFSTLSDADAFNFVRASFLQVGLRAVDIRYLENKEMGTGSNTIRVGFDPEPNFNVYNMQKIATLKAPDNTTWYTKASREFAISHNIHDYCLGSLDKRAPDHLICKCSTNSSAGPSMSSAHRQAAKLSFQERARKRAREDADPFA